MKLEQYIHHHIPISKELGVNEIEVTPNKVILQGSYEKNINHKNTVFGGSLQTLCVLSCWSIIHINLKTLPDNYEIVICDSNTKYLKPVTADFQAVAELNLENESWVKFQQQLQRKGRGKFTVSAVINNDNQTAVKFAGTFACLKCR